MLVADRSTGKTRASFFEYLTATGKPPKVDSFGGFCVFQTMGVAMRRGESGFALISGLPARKILIGTQLLPITDRRQIRFILELFGKQGRRGETALIRDFRYGERRGRKQLFRVFQPFIQDILFRGDADCVVKDMAEPIVRVICDFGQRFQRNIRLKVFFDIVDCKFDRIRMKGRIDGAFVHPIDFDDDVVHAIMRDGNVIVGLVLELGGDNFNVTHDGLIAVGKNAGGETLIARDAESQAEQAARFEMKVVVLCVRRDDDAVMFGIVIPLVSDVAVSVARKIIDQLIAFMRMTVRPEFYGVAAGKLKMNVG